MEVRRGDVGMFGGDGSICSMLSSAELGRGKKRRNMRRMEEKGTDGIHLEEKVIKTRTDKATLAFIASNVGVCACVYVCVCM